MSDWQRVERLTTTRAVPATPAASELSNYYDGLSEYDSDSVSPSEFLPTDFWEDAIDPYLIEISSASPDNSDFDEPPEDPDATDADSITSFDSY